MANIPATMPRFSLFLYNQRKRVRYPESLNLADVDAAQRVARRVADVFMAVVPYWDELTPAQQNRYVVEIMDEAGGLLMIVPFRQERKRKLIRLKRPITGIKKPHQNSSTDGAD
ncbi:hypothetical protein AAII07_51815 [Microvirga sp. 0TCS3.31]